MRQIFGLTSHSFCAGESLRLSAAPSCLRLQVVGAVLVSRGFPIRFGIMSDFGAAAEAMRRILVDNARGKRNLKRGAALERAELRSRSKRLLIT